MGGVSTTSRITATADLEVLCGNHQLSYIILRFDTNLSNADAYGRCVETRACPFGICRTSIPFEAE